MSLTIPNTYVSGSDISAEDIVENLQAVRDYINGGVVIGDIEEESLNSTHIARPDIIYADNHIQEANFTSAYVYVHQRPYEQDLGNFTSSITNHLKGTNFILRATYEDVADLGKTFFLQKSANVIVHVFCWAKSFFNEVQASPGDSDEYYLYVDGNESGDRQNSTLAYIGAINGAGDPSASPPNDADEQDQFRVLTFTWSGFLATGEHTLQVKTNSRTEHGICKIKYFFIEALY